MPSLVISIDRFQMFEGETPSVPFIVLAQLKSEKQRQIIEEK
jgi:hypothetical protein